MKENTYIYREIMDKLNESPMLVTNYLMSDLRCDNHALDPAQVEKCYSGLLDEYAKVGSGWRINFRIVVMNVYCVI